MKKTRKNAIFFSWEMYMVLEMDIVSSRYYAYVNGTYDVQQIELSHFYNNFDVRKKHI